MPETTITQTETVEQPERTFTQAEVDALIARRVSRVTRGLPSEEEMTAFRNWQSNQQNEQQRWNNLTTERDTARGRVTALEAELEQMKRENYIYSKGLTGEDAEYVAFKAAKLMDDKTDFNAAVDKVMEERAKKPTFDWSASLGGDNTKPNTNAAMNALIRGAFK